ncbi:major facilitator superfamily domain-containing protein [Phaeosphaeria sp. MPI-PUGE-AT-0046c]|nr:major facilitator superfamily domain-containing protein [Phaeosphaeria sp. MPI-PUGE-AT-0046c]
MESTSQAVENMLHDDSEKKGVVTNVAAYLDTQHHHDSEATPVYLHGLRFWLITVSLAIALFVTNMEITFVNTSLVAITKDLGNADNIGWVVSSYLLGYVGVLVIFAKLSDILGSKTMISASIFLFVVFSGACGAAQTFSQLTVLRAFEGIGGPGPFAVTTVMMSDMVPPEKLAKFVAGLSSVFAISLLVGPIIGGVFSSQSTWRWVFLINIPIATPAGTVASAQSKTQNRQRVDFAGATLLLLATLSLTSSFEEAGSRFSWASAYVITLIVISGALWIILILWERSITHYAPLMEPVLPWRFFGNRAMVSLMLNALFLGGPWFVGIFQLPQKFQILHGATGTMAGMKTMPFTFASALGTGVSEILAKKGPVVYVVIVLGVLQTIGFALLATLPYSASVPARTYGYQIIAGFGCGINSSTLLLLVPFVVNPRDKAVGMAIVSQLRTMGGAIVLSIVTSVFNSYCTPLLSQHMSHYGLTRDLIYSPRVVATLSDADQASVKAILAAGFNRQMIVLSVFAAAQIPSSLLLWRKEQIRV